MSLSEALEADPALNFVSINPLQGRRADANVTHYRNFLIEFDGIPIEEQVEALTSLQVPYTTLVHSGGKSLHAVIALTNEVSSEEYKELAKLIQTIIWQSDPTQKNPSRLTRVAEAIRPETMAPQTLLDIRNRVTPERLLKWIGRFSAHIERVEERERRLAAEREERREKALASGATSTGLVDVGTLAFLRGEAKAGGSRHARLVAAICELYDCGVEYMKALEMAETAADAHGITEDPRRLREAEKIVSYVYSGRRKSY